MVLFRKNYIWFTIIISFLILLPSISIQAINTIGLYNEKRYFQVGLFIVFIILFLIDWDLQNRVAAFINQFSYKTKLVVTLIFLTGIISSMFAIYSDWAFLEVGHYSILLFSTLVIATLANRDPQTAYTYLLYATLGTALFYLLRVGFSYALFLSNDFPLWPGDRFSVGLFGFAHVRFFNHIQTWTLPILISVGWYYWSNKENSYYKWFLMGLIVGWEVLIIASGARGTTLGVGLAFLVLILFTLNKPWEFIKFNFSLGIASVLSFFIFFYLPAGESQKTLLRDSSSGRIEAWLGILPDILQRPLLGYGPLHYASADLNNWLSSPHNWFLQFSYEWGLFAAILVLLITATGLLKFNTWLKTFNKSLSSKDYWLTFGLLWSILAIFIHGFFSGLINTPLSQIWFVLIVGISIGVYSKNNDTSSKASVLISKLCIYTLLIFSIGSFFNWTINHPLDRSKVDKNYLETSEINHYAPRFWQQGKIGLDRGPKNEEKSIDESNF